MQDKQLSKGKVAAILGMVAETARKIMSKGVKPTRTQVVIGRMIRTCPGGMHAWFESNVGPVRKEYVWGRMNRTWR